MPKKTLRTWQWFFGGIPGRNIESPPAIYTASTPHHTILWQYCHHHHRIINITIVKRYFLYFSSQTVFVFLCVFLESITVWKETRWRLLGETNHPALSGDCLCVFYCLCLCHLCEFITVWENLGCWDKSSRTVQRLPSPPSLPSFMSLHLLHKSFNSSKL